MPEMHPRGTFLAQRIRCCLPVARSTLTKREGCDGDSALTPGSRLRTKPPALQAQELEEYIRGQRWHLVASYTDAISGTKARRVGLDRLMSDARQRKFDCVLVWKLDRFGRSLVDCLTNIQALESYGVRFIAVTQGLDTDERNPASRFMLQVLGAAAEFERSLIVERSRAGQLRYRRDYEAGKVGATVHSRSGKNLPPRHEVSHERPPSRPSATVATYGAKPPSRWGLYWPPSASTRGPAQA